MALVVKNLPANAGDVDPSLGREDPPGEGNGDPLQYPCLENPMDRGAWQGTVRGVAKCQTRLKRLYTHTRTGGPEEEKLKFYITSWSFCLCNSAGLLAKSGSRRSRSLRKWGLY